MKKFCLIVAAALMAVGCNGPKTYKVEGQIVGSDEPIEVKVADRRGEVTYAETTSDNQGNFSIKLKSQVPMLAYLYVDGKPRTYVPLDEADLKISIDLNNPSLSTLEGGKAAEGYMAYNKATLEIEAAHAQQENKEALYEALDRLVAENYEQNKDNLWGIFLFTSQLYYEMSAEEILNTIAAMPEHLQQVAQVVTLQQRAETMKKTEVGQKFIPIESTDPEGNTIALADVLAKNKYVLLDFWASWCPPCMAEMPYLLKDYATYHAKGFEIYGVSLDRSADAWKQCIADKGMEWVNVSSLQYWNEPTAKLYAVGSIPTNFLIASDGTIVAKNLRGEAVAEKLAELLGE